MSDGGVRMFNSERRFYLKAAAAATLSLNWPALAFSQTPFLQLTDLAGRSVVLSRMPQRFVVANYIANFLFVGGAKAVDQIVGITADGWESTRYAEYVRLTQAFAQLKNIPSIGGYHDDILNTEKILSLKPDVVILGQTQYAQNAQRLRLLEKAGIAVVVLDYHAMTLQNHVKSTQLLGKLLNREEVAQEQINRYIETIQTIQTRIAKADNKVKQVPVYVECGNLGVGSYGNSYNKTVLWGGILRRLQVNNIAADMPAPYASLSREFVLAKNPGIIFIAGSIWQNAAENDQMRMGLMVPRTEALQRLSGFIRRPFLRRNFRIGLLSAAIADVVLWSAANWLVGKEPDLLEVITPMVMVQVSVAVLLFGIVITWLCALFSINKYLRMKAGTLYYI